MPNNLQYLFRLKLKTEKKQSFFFKRHILKKIPTIQQGKKNYSLNVFSIFLESVSKLNEIVSCDDTEAKWTQTGVTFHFGWNFILGDKISCKHYPKWNTYTCPSKKRVVLKCSRNETSCERNLFSRRFEISNQYEFISPLMWTCS